MGFFSKLLGGGRPAPQPIIQQPPAPEPVIIEKEVPITPAEPIKPAPADPIQASAVDVSKDDEARRRRRSSGSSLQLAKLGSVNNIPSQSIIRKTLGGV